MCWVFVWHGSQQLWKSCFEFSLCVRHITEDFINVLSHLSLTIPSSSVSKGLEEVNCPEVTWSVYGETKTKAQVFLAPKGHDLHRGLMSKKDMSGCSIGHL